MRILLVNDYATPTGGAEIQMLSLRQAFRHRGHDARLFASSVADEGERPDADYICFGTSSRGRGVLQTVNLSAARAMSRALREFRPDVVHVRIFLTQLSPMILPALRAVPSLYHAVWYRSICPVGTKLLPDGSNCHQPAGLKCLQNRCLPAQDWAPLMLQMRLLRRWMGTFRHVVANSEAARRRLMEGGIAPVRVIPNGVPAWPARPPLSWPPLVGFAGRLVPEKGVHVLIGAFAQVVKTHPAARLILLGSGPEQDRLEQLVSHHGLTGCVEMLGRMSREHMEQKFARLWVQVVPSTWDEPFANTALEAMVRGTAVVATTAGGLAEIVDEGETGFLVPPHAESRLADAISRLIADRELAEQMGRRGREVALRNFSQDRCADRFVELYSEMCSGTAAPRRVAQPSTLGAEG